MSCPIAHTHGQNGKLTCQLCTWRDPAAPPPARPVPDPFRSEPAASEPRFTALSTLATLLTWAGWLALAGGLLTALAMAVMALSRDTPLAVLAALPYALSGALSCLVLVAAAEVIRVLLAIEDHLYRLANRRAAP